jgi:FlaA1/EpsC-like NDP-sugar epimerase
MMKKSLLMRNRFVFLGDILLIIIGVFGSYALRLELGSGFEKYLPSLFYMIGISLIVKPFVYYFFGLYRRMWIYASIQELKIIAIAVGSASILVAAFMLILNMAIRAFTNFPRSVLIIDFVLSLLAVGGFRLILRVIAESRILSARGNIGLTKRALVIGAGDAGALVVREMQKNPQLNLKPIGFLDDNPEKQKQQIYNVPIIGKIEDLSKVLDHQKIAEVIIAIPSAPGAVIRVVADACRKKNIPFRTMPGLYELLGGKVSINRLREVDIEDLLRRQPTRINDEKIGETVGGKIVLVTGAGGSIGRELCRQIARWNPEQLLLLGHGENSIYESLLELKESYPDLKTVPLIADIRDKPRLQILMEKYRPNVIFHAAAHKHVPLMEFNVEEAVTNNVLGTKHLVETALKANVDRLVMISTDKAILPANVMGATKRLAEMIVLDAARQTGKAYSVVRFGNVLGSRGSVVPLFKHQIAHGGPVTVTHPDMKRYFMTIPEAVYLVLQAASMGTGGEAFILNMGEQVRILDLAEDLIRLSGLEPGKDVEIAFTGIRPGEKLREDLWDDSHVFKPTAHPEIFQLNEQELIESKKLKSGLDEIIRLSREGETQTVIDLLDAVIPGSNVRLSPPSEFTVIDS